MSNEHHGRAAAPLNRIWGTLFINTLQPSTLAGIFDSHSFPPLSPGTRVLISEPAVAQQGDNNHWFLWKFTNVSERFSFICLGDKIAPFFSSKDKKLLQQPLNMEALAEICIFSIWCISLTSKVGIHPLHSSCATWRAKRLPHTVALGSIICLSGECNTAGCSEAELAQSGQAKSDPAAKSQRSLARLTPGDSPRCRLVCTVLSRCQIVKDLRCSKWRSEKLSLWLNFSAGGSHWQQMEKCHISVCIWCQIGCRVAVPVEIITHMWVARSHDTWNDYMTVLITVFDAVVFCIH